jgi:hypothetical protein
VPTLSVTFLRSADSRNIISASCGADIPAPPTVDADDAAAAAAGEELTNGAVDVAPTGTSIR